MFVSSTESFVLDDNLCKSIVFYVCFAHARRPEAVESAAVVSLLVWTHPSLTLQPSRGSGAPSAPAAFGGGLASLGLAELREVLCPWRPHLSGYFPSGVQRRTPLGKYLHLDESFHVHLESVQVV